MPKITYSSQWQMTQNNKWLKMMYASKWQMTKNEKLLIMSNG